SEIHWLTRTETGKNCHLTCSYESTRHQLPTAKLEPGIFVLHGLSKRSKVAQRATVPGIAGEALAMRITTYILFVLILSACAGCTIVRDFCGSAANLKSHGEWIPPGTHLKMNVACSGSAPNG